MTFKYNDRDYNYPTTLAEITLQQRIEFQELYGKSYEALSKGLLEIEDENIRSVKEAESNILFACQCFAYFTTIPLNEVEDYFNLVEVMEIYNNHFSKLLEPQTLIVEETPYIFNDEEWNMPTAQLLPNSKITFNEFITSKEIVRQLEISGQGKWKSILYLCCIYLRKKDEAFNESLLEEAGERMKFMKSLSLDKAIAVDYFFEQFNEFIAQHFGVFKQGSSKGIDLSAHFERYGWVSFLSYVAEKGVLFYISNGKSNLDNIKQTSLYEVLLWSSEAKEKEEAISHYYEEQQKK